MDFILLKGKNRGYRHRSYISIMFIMQISLKKQIHIKKILKIISTHDVVLLFNVFYLPQKNRQILKKKHLVLSENQNKLEPQALNIKQKEKNKYLFVETPLLGTSLEKPQQEAYYILHIHNKSAQKLEIFSNIPLSGHTLLFAIQRKEDAQYLFTSAKSLYKGVFLGGFYKNVYKKQSVLKALCFALFNKYQIYKTFFRAMSFTGNKNLRTMASVNKRYLCLLKKSRQKQVLSIAQ